MKKFFKRAIDNIRANKEMLVVGLVVSMIGPILASSIMFAVG